MREAKTASKRAIKMEFKMVVINFQSYLQPKTINKIISKYR